MRAARSGAAETWQRRAETSCLLNDNGVACCYAVLCGVCVSFSPPLLAPAPISFLSFSVGSPLLLNNGDPGPTSTMSHYGRPLLANSEQDIDRNCILTQFRI